jgi:glycerol-1-phosphate dehydrogenase [NAD(P)+]
MVSKITSYIGHDASTQLINFCHSEGLSKLLLVADRNTYRVLARHVEEELLRSGFDFQSVILDSHEVVADASHVLDVLLAFDGAARSFIAVGSGTITDITRFVSHRTGNTFISMPTAPSVDGFASIGAPLIVRGVKITYITQPPIAIFANLSTLTTAPPTMIAAGFADMVGKYTSVADWQLGHLLWDEPYDDNIARRTRAALQRCVDQVETIQAADPGGIQILMESLIESGVCILECGNSYPASGTEHHYSHFWEMQLLRQGRPAILHGAKVGVATIEVAGLYALIRQIPRHGLLDLLEQVTQPHRETMVQQIHSVYGADLSGDIIAGQNDFLNMKVAVYEDLKCRILEQWDRIQEIAQSVPDALSIAGLLRQVGSPTTIQELGLNATELALAAQHSHYLRDRFTIAKLLYFLGRLSTQEIH